MVINRTRHLGFSLTEIMITTVIAALIFTGVINILISSDETVSDTVNRGELQENGRLALQLLSRDIMMAGYFGPFTRKTFGPTTVGGNHPFPVKLHDGVGGGPVVGLIQSTECGQADTRLTNNGTFYYTNVAFNKFREFRTLTGFQNNNPAGSLATLGGCISNAKADSNVIQLKRMIAQDIDLNDVSETRYYMMARSNEAVIFAGSDIALGQPPMFLDGTSENAIIGEYQHYVYFVEEETRGDYSVPMLRRKYLYKDKASTRDQGKLGTQTLVEGIEKLGFLYGVDTDEDNVINYYAKAEEIDLTPEQWENQGARIIAVKVFVLVRTVEPDVNTELNTQTFDLGSHTATFGSSDSNYRRMVFSNTVMLLNQGDSAWQN